jgi:hypothetical protein
LSTGIGACARHRLDAGAEGRAGEQDRVRAGRGSVTSKREKAFGHRFRQPAVAREIGGETVVEQVHPNCLGPEPGKGFLGRHKRMFEGVDQSNAHDATIAQRPRRSSSAAMQIISIQTYIPA